MTKIELICVTTNNNNKFYRMTDLENGQFEIEYGRVGYVGTKETYPMSKWKSKYNEKLKKGYVDTTPYKKVSTQGDVSCKESSVQSFYDTFSLYSSNTVKQNYNVSSSVVTKVMIEDAQDIINQLVNNPSNDLLIKLFTIIPRKMYNVSDWLFTNNEPDIIITREQSLLDSLSSNIVSLSTDNTTIEELFNINIIEESNDSILGMINTTNRTGIKPYKMFKVEQKSTIGTFNNWLEKQSNQNTEYLIHGTRSENVFSILKNGLLIRPTNVVLSGSVYGNGIYHSSHATKSMGYTSNSKDRIFFIQKVHTGKKYVYNGWYREGKGLSSSNMNYNYLSKQGYDSLYVEPGDGLLNSEYIVYNKEQTTTGYLVWLK